MPDYLIHKSKTGIANTAEWQETDMHQLQNQAAGDILYAADGTHLTRLAKQTDGNKLVLASGLPAWASSQHTHGEATEAAGGQLTSPFINEAVAMLVTSTNLNLVDDTNFFAKLLLRAPFGSITQLYLRTTTGSASGWCLPSSASLNTGVTTGSTIEADSNLYAAAPLNNFTNFDFSKDYDFIFQFQLNDQFDASTIRRMQVRSQVGTAIDVLTAKGMGIEILNRAVYAESYGAHRDSVDTGYSISDWQNHILWIAHRGTLGTTTWYIDNFVTPLLTKSDANHVPSGSGAYYCQFVASCENGAGIKNVSLSPNYLFIVGTY